MNHSKRELEEQLIILEKLEADLLEVQRVTTTGVIEALMDSDIEQAFSIAIQGAVLVRSNIAAIAATRERIGVTRRRIDILKQMRDAEIEQRGKRMNP